MSSRQSLVGVAIAAVTTLALAACTSPPPGNDPIVIDAQYGIPPDSVPSYLLEAGRVDDQRAAAGAAL